MMIHMKGSYTISKTLLGVKLTFLPSVFTSEPVLLYLQSLNSTRHVLHQLPSLFFSFLIAEDTNLYLQHNTVQYRGLSEMLCRNDL